MNTGDINKEHPSVFGRDMEKLDELLALGLDEAGNEETEALWPNAFVDGCIDEPGTQIGRYKLVRVLGEGGMGIVHLAEQAHPIQRQVALKVIKPGMDTKQVIAHFEAERQVLTFFDHPNIAHVYDAGMTLRGRPFFVFTHLNTNLFRIVLDVSRFVRYTCSVRRMRNPNGETKWLSLTTA